MSLFEKLKYSGKWQSLEVIILVIAQFLYLAVMARILEKSDFGLMAIANSFLVFGMIFSESGMGAALIQKKGITNKHINAALQGGLITGILLFLVFFFLAHRISIFFNNSQLNYLIKIISINFLILSISSVSSGIIQKEYKFREKAQVRIFSVIVSYTAGIICGLYGLGVWSLVIANILLSIFTTIGYVYHSKIKLIKGIFINEWKELFSFGFGITLLQISNYIANSGINIVLGKVFAPSVLGVFERTYNIKTLPSRYIGDVLDRIMFPAMSEIQDERERLFKLYQSSLGIVNTILMPISVYLIFFSQEIVLILLGKNWNEAVVPLQIMFILLPFSSSGRMADSVIRAKGLIYKNVFRKFLYVVVLLITTTYGGYKYGLLGASVGVTISYLFNYVIMLFLVRKIFNKSINEIFFDPVLAGFKLALVVLIILVSITSILNLWSVVSILYFVVLSFTLFVIISLLVLNKPSFFGQYLNEILIRFKKD